MESNEEGNLYGAVTQKSIVESILGSMSIKLSTDSVILTPIKALGMHEIKIHLYDEVYANINLEIINKS
jgi:large subunit ribosomal protein L9